MIYFIIGVVAAFIVAMAAPARGRSPVGWFIYGLVLWPLALIHVLVLPKNEKAIERRQVEKGERRPCPHCAEPIRPEARICRFCGRDVDPAGAVSIAQADARHAEAGDDPIFGRLHDDPDRKRYLG